MAAGATTSGSSGIFWMNGVSDEEQPLVFVPGVDGKAITRTTFIPGPGSSGALNKRGSMVQGAAGRSSDCRNEAVLKKGGKKQGHLQSDHSGAYIKEKVSVSQSTAVLTEHMPSLASDAFLPPLQIISETSRTRSQVCLKDLCSEDKRRIANLIEELARVSEEKEVSVQRLKDEQENFECKIQQLEQQNLLIAHERESLQQQYRECQELLGLYQKYLSQQQVKLNESIVQLSQVSAHNKVLSSDEAHSITSTTRANGLLFDGSYLSLHATKARQPQVPRSGDGGRGAEPTSSQPASLACVCDIICSGDHPTKQCRIHRHECGKPQFERCYRCDHCHGSCHGTQQQRSDNDLCLANGHRDTLKPQDCERLQSRTAMGSEDKEALTRPLLGHKDWEEKRHQLLLQKMQLEMERERLQARLEEQEERLHRQNQQLCQSRLDYSRFQQANQAELRSSKTGTGDSQLEGPSSQDLPASVLGDAEVNHAKLNLHEKCPQPVPAPEDYSTQTCEQSRRDTAMSPPRSQAQVPASLSKTTAEPVKPNTPDARLDFSLVDVLDMFSPVSAHEQSKSSSRRTKMTRSRPALATPKPVARTLLTSARPHRQSTQQDLEESQILEDIFFIC